MLLIYLPNYDTQRMNLYKTYASLYLVVEYIESVGKVMVTQSGNRESVCGHDQDFHVGFLILATKVVNNFETTKGNGKNSA